MNEDAADEELESRASSSGSQFLFARSRTETNMDPFDRLGAFGMRLARRRLAVFPEGLGSGGLDRLVERMPAPEAPIAPVDVSWRVTGCDGQIERSTARFESPAGSDLPAAAREVHAEKIDPIGGASRLIVLLQMWGDEGVSLRRRLARHLAARGIATVLPVNPFYGRRRNHAVGPPIRTVEEFLRMGIGAIAEVRSLLDRLRRDYIVGLGGFSMGSGFSVGASTTLPFPVALALMGAAPSPARAFTDGVLQQGLDEELRGQGRARLVRALDSVSALGRPVLDHHRRAVILAARKDGFVPVNEAVALAEHWKGAELRLVGGGHATLWFLQTRAKVDAIERAFDRHCDHLETAAGDPRPPLRGTG